MKKGSFSRWKTLKTGGKPQNNSQNIGQQYYRKNSVFYRELLTSYQHKKRAKNPLFTLTKN